MDGIAAPGVPEGDAVIAAREAGYKEPHPCGSAVAVHTAVLGDAVGPQQPQQGLVLVAAGEAGDPAALDTDRSVEVPPAKARPVDQRQKAAKRTLRGTHPRGQDMRLAVRPAHAAADRAR